MKKIWMSAILLLGAFSLNQAFADAKPAGCELHFAVHLESYIFFSQGSGEGLVICRAVGGKLHKANVNVAVDGIGLGIGVFDLQGIAGNLGILDPKELVGTYAVVEAEVGAGGAVGAALGFEGQENGLSFTGSVNAGRGIGVLVNGTRWTITLRK